MKKEKFLMEKIQKIIILKKELKNYLVKRYRIPKNRLKLINKLNKRLIVLFKTKYQKEAWMNLNQMKMKKDNKLQQIQKIQLMMKIMEKHLMKLMEMLNKLKAQTNQKIQKDNKNQLDNMNKKNYKKWKMQKNLLKHMII